MVAKAQFDTLRSLGFGSISGTYAAVGAALTQPPRIIAFTNQTNGDMIFSYDNTLSAGQIFLAAGNAMILDLNANMIPGKDDSFELPAGITFYVKQSTAPSSGSVYISIVY